MSTNKIETRAFGVAEVRAIAEEGSPQKVGGYAAKFNSMSEELYDFYEIIAPGCFARAIREDDVRATWNHDPNFVLGRNKSGTLRLKEDDIGLAFEFDAPDTQMVRDMVLSPISRGDVTQCSFRFRTISDSWVVKEGKTIRTLLEVELSDIAITTYPAYQNTDVALRSRDAALKLPPPDHSWQAEIRRRRLDLLL